MGNCACWVNPLNELNSLQNSRKVMETAPLHIPNMHPKIYALAEKVFANNSETIEKVELQDREIGDEGGRYLSAILPYLINLIYLDMQNMNISSNSWDQLLISIEEINSLRHLDLSKNRLSEGNIEILSRALLRNNDLEALLLESVGISSTGMAGLSSSIACMKKLKILALGSNFLEDSGLMSLSNVLSYISLLQFLDLSKNSFTHLSTPYLASGLLNLQSLKVLKIGDNLLKDEGFIIVIKALGNSVEELAINQIGLSEAGLKQLCEKLPELTKLNHLQLDYNNIDHKTSLLLINILPVLNLKYLSLIGCDVSSHRKALSLAHSCTEVLI